MVIRCNFLFEMLTGTFSCCISNSFILCAGGFLVDKVAYSISNRNLRVKNYFEKKKYILVIC